jgi:hypothetical protein
MTGQSVGPKEPARVLTPEGKSKKATPVMPPPRLAWSVLGWFGIAAALIGAFDILLAWYPLRGGDAAWEFGIINLTVWSLPFLTTGLVFLMAAGLALESRWRVRLAAIVMLVLALLLLAAMLLYALAIPVALNGAPAAVQMNVKKSILKTVVLGVTFPTLYIGLAIAALKRRRSGS